MADIYQEFSRTWTKDGEEIYADTEIVVYQSGATYRVKSRMTPTYMPVHLDGANVREFFRKLTLAKKAVIEHDRREASRKPIPKPTRLPKTLSETLASCPYCGGSGFTEDEWGYESVCECRC